MKSLFKKLFAGIITAALIASVMTVPAFASSSYKYVTPSIKVKSKVVAGEEVSNNSLHESEDTATDGEINVSVSNSDYYKITDLEFVSDEEHIVKVGEQIKIKVTLETYSYDSSTGKELKFGSSCKVSGAESTGYSRYDSNTSCVITVKLKAADGQYEEPEEAYWSSTNRGTAKWTAPEFTSGYYDVTLYRGSSTVTTVTVHGTSYNFYYKDWMGKKGEYRFKVRTVPEPDSSTAKSSQKSDWMESDDLDLDENQVATVAGKGDDGMGTGSSEGYVGDSGWVQTSGTWYYKYPDGTLKKNGWEKIGGKWYLFDSTGAMMTGWQTSGGKIYYLDATNGDMKTGWVSTASGDWYYLNPNVGGPEGALLQNAWLDYGGNRYYLGSNGVMVVGWYQIDGKYYYFNPNSGGPKGAMAKNTRIGSFYVDSNGVWIQGA